VLVLLVSIILWSQAAGEAVDPAAGKVAEEAVLAVY
jgi:hypothetical protein